MKLQLSLLAAVLIIALTGAVPEEFEAQGKNDTMRLTQVFFPGLVELKSINANGGYFWIDKPTASACKIESKLYECINFAKNRTVMYSITEGALALASASKFVTRRYHPRYYSFLIGQRVYLDPTGALRYANPKQLYVPEGSIVDGFVYNYGLLLLRHDRVYYISYACSDGEHSKIYFINGPKIPKNCERFAIKPREVVAAHQFF